MDALEKVKINQHRANAYVWPWVGLTIIFVLGCFHRILQLWLVWPQLVLAIKAAPNNQVMQLLPKVIMSEHPWWGLWYLQQSPPIPNILWATALAVTQSQFDLAIIFILFQGLLSSISAVVLALLFFRFGTPRWLGMSLAFIFLMGSDLLTLEYSQAGEFYYEMMTMLLALLSCHAALSHARSRSSRPAALLGLCVAALALTRASFSYFWLPVLVWLFCIGGVRKPKPIMYYLLPILFFHGGWALKNYYVHDYWSWSTSSWGGANIQQGERNRNGPRFNRWMAQQPPICTSPWHELTAAMPNYFFFRPAQWNIPPPADVAAKDQRVAEKRGASTKPDTDAMRLWAQCLQSEFVQYWKTHPRLLLTGAWRSYQIFWLPIRQFAVTQPFPLRLNMDIYAEGLYVWRALKDAWGEWSVHYSMRRTPLRLAPPLSNADYVPTRIIALPFFASFISAANLVVLHSLPLLLVLAAFFRCRLVWPKGFLFPLMLYGYLALLSSVVEYGENMRFRIDVEPVIWVLCFIIARAWYGFGEKMITGMRGSTAK